MAVATTPPSFRTAVGYSMAQKYIAFVVHMALTVLLARLLTPQETGVFSLGAAAVAMGHLLRDFGMADYVISQKDASSEKLRAAFTVTLLLAWGIAALLWLAAWPMAELYKEDGVRQVMHVLCISFILLPFGSIVSAVLSKEMRFRLLFVIQTLVIVLSAVVTLVCAWRGLSYMSLAYGAVAASFGTIAILLLLQPKAVFLKPTLRGLREVVKFGGALTLARALEQVSNRAGDFIASGMLGFHAGGLLSKANSLNGTFHEFFNSAVMRVATPSFARTEQADGDVREPYIRATVIVATAHWLFFPILGIFAPEIVWILFGANWMECVPAVQISAAFAMFWAPFMLSNSLLTARRAVAQQLRMHIICTPVAVAALFLGSLHSLEALVLLANIAMLLRLVLTDLAMRQVCGIGVEAVLGRLRATVLTAAAAIVCGAAARWFLGSQGWPAWVVLPLGVASMLVTAALVAWMTRHPAVDEVRNLWHGARAR